LELSISTSLSIINKNKASISASDKNFYAVALKPPFGGGLVGLLSTLTFAAQKKLHSDKKDERIATQR